MFQPKYQIVYLHLNHLLAFESFLLCVTEQKQSGAYLSSHNTNLRHIPDILDAIKIEAFYRHQDSKIQISKREPFRMKPDGGIKQLELATLFPSLTSAFGWLCCWLVVCSLKRERTWIDPISICAPFCIERRKNNASVSQLASASCSFVILFNLFLLSSTFTMRSARPLNTVQQQPGKFPF